MESSKQAPDLFDPVRNIWVKKSPEEAIRQAWICKLTEELGFPRHLLAVEKELSTLPHLQHRTKREIPKRRVDIVAFAKNIHPNYPLFPLLMIECKALALTPTFIDKVANQVISYNTVVQAPFVALANERQVFLGSFDKRVNLFTFVEGMRSYQELLDSLRL